MSSVTKKSEKPSYWRSLAELEGTPEFEQFIEHEFAEPVSDLPPTSDERRRFMQLMGASFAFAGLAGLLAAGYAFRRLRVINSGVSGPLVATDTVQPQT